MPDSKLQNPKTVNTRPAFAFSSKLEHSPPREEDHTTSRLKKEDLKRRFRLDEFLAEKLITGVALVSLASVVMIFVFVFREAVPVFFTKENSTPV